MLFSVVIPTFNRVHLLPQTLESVFAQRFTDYEIIIVDDGSTDQTGAYLASLGERVTYVTQPRQGPGAARNLGARNAAGEYCAFLDSDDLWCPWTLSCFAELIRQHKHPAVLAAKLVEFSEEANLRTLKETRIRAATFSDYFASHRHPYFVGAGMSVLRRDVFLDCRGYTTEISNSEDHDLIMRLGEERGFVQVLAPITLACRKHPGGITRDPRRSFEGASYLVKEERTGAYPGGTERTQERRAIITRVTRPVTIELAGRGFFQEAWALYRATWLWNISLNRWKYVVGFLAKALLAWISKTPNPEEKHGCSTRNVR